MLCSLHQYSSIRISRAEMSPGFQETAENLTSGISKSRTTWEEKYDEAVEMLNK